MKDPIQIWLESRQDDMKKLESGDELEACTDSFGKKLPDPTGDRSDPLLILKDINLLMVRTAVLELKKEGFTVTYREEENDVLYSKTGTFLL
jgi:hypothetical protein